MKLLLVTILLVSSISLGQQAAVFKSLKLLPTTLPAKCTYGDMRISAGTDILNVCQTPNTWSQPLTTQSTLVNAGGDILYSTASSLAFLAPGTSGQVLTSAGSNAPTWNGAVIATAYMTSNTSTTTDTPINFDHVVIDTASAITTGASWVYTIPKTGYYLISYIGATTASGTTSAYLRVNGSGKNFIVYHEGSSQLKGNSLIYFFTAGDTFAIDPNTTVTFTGLSTTAPTTQISIMLIK